MESQCQKLNFRLFAELTELKAKTASIFPFALGLAYSLYHYQRVDILALVIYFVAMFLFNCFVDCWDNWNDYHHALDTANYKQKTNIIGRENLDLSQLKRLLAGLFFGSLILGLIVAYMVGWAVFFLGLFCYLVGIFYSWGPRPLSSLPLGEFFSGLTMGYFIFLIAVFINAHAVFTWNWLTLGQTFLVALPNVLLIKNLMLANNTCDLEEDESNKRFTIVHYMGKVWAVRWWLTSLILAFLLLCLNVALKLLPWTILVMILLIPWTVKQARPYLKNQVKRETFIHSVTILMVFQLIEALLFFLGILV